MFCANCGTKNEDGAVFCAGCGQKLDGAPAPMAPASNVAPAPAPAPVEFNGFEDEATVAAYFNPATGVTTPTPVAPAPVAPAPAPAPYAQPVAPAPAPEAYAQPVAPAPAPEAYAQPVAPAPAPEAYAQPVAPAPAPEAYAQPVAPAPAPDAYAQPVAPAPAPVNTDANAPANTAPKKPVNKTIFFIIGGVAAVVLIAIIIIVASSLGGSSSGKAYTAEWNCFYSVDDEVTNIVYGDKVFKDTIDGNAYIECYSMDRTVVVFYNEDQEFFIVTSNGKINSLGESLESVNISSDGSTIAYVDEDNDLYSYKVSNGKASKISEDVVSAILSPSGKSLAYIVDDEDDYVMYVYNGKTETELSKNATPISINDSCSYIYYRDNNKDALYVTNLKDDSNKIDSDVDGSYVLNSDHSELMYTTDNGVFVSVKGGDKQKVSGKSYFPVYIGVYANQQYYSDPVSGALTYNLSSMKNQYYMIGDTLVKVDKKWSGDKAISGIDDIEISDNLKTVYYTNDKQTLYTCKLDGKYDATKIKADVTSFGMTRDGSAVYFLVDGQSLYYQKGKSDSTKIATDVHRMRVSSDGIAFFMLDYDDEDNTGTLYYSKSGKDKQKITSDVYSFYCDNGVTYYYDNYESEDNYNEITYSYSCYYSYDVNITTGGTNFKKILSGVGYKYSN